MKTAILCCALAVVAGAQEPVSYQRSSAGVRTARVGAATLKVLVDSATLGGKELELVEIAFPPNVAGRGPHVHGRVEVLYILSGEMDHVVNGTAHHLKPGMAGIVRPGDSVIHRVTSADTVRALVIWAPGGELARVAP